MSVNKFNLSVQDVCRLLDEDDIFSPQGQLILDDLQHKASMQFRQTKKRSEQQTSPGGQGSGSETAYGGA